MQWKSTLKDLGKTPRHRTYASGPALKVPTRPTVGPSAADSREKRTDRNLGMRAAVLRRATVRSRLPRAECIAGVL
jgi:hypothetical protein